VKHAQSTRRANGRGHMLDCVSVSIDTPRHELAVGMAHTEGAVHLRGG